MCTDEGANYITMSKNLLGKGGEVVAWATYLLLLYSLMAAYLTGGGGIVRTSFHALTSIHLSTKISPLPWIVIAGLFIYAGTTFVDGLNRLLMLGLFITYGLLVMVAVPHSSMKLINSGGPGFVLMTLPILSTAFGYHVIIPTLRTYLHGDVKKLSTIILLGSGIPLVVYILWNFVVFSIIPIQGEHSLTSLYLHGGQPVELTQTLASLLKTPWLVSVTEAFIFFAIASSFLGISLSLFDFLADGLHIAKSWYGKVVIAIMTFLPPLLYAEFYPSGFILALSYAGIFVAILHGILPALMVIAARRGRLSKRYRAPGGYVGLALILASALLIIGVVLK